MVLSGVLKYDPELRFTRAGNAVLSFVLVLPGGGEAECEMWNKAAEDTAADGRFSGPALRSRQVVLTGRWRERLWQRDGVKHTARVFAADRIRPGRRTGE